MDKDTHDFARAYGIDYTLSSRNYVTGHLNPTLLGTPAYNAHVTMERTPGMQLTMPQDQFNSLRDDANLGRETRRCINANPAVREAWLQYKMLVELTRE